MTTAVAKKNNLKLNVLTKSQMKKVVMLATGIIMLPTLSVLAAEPGLTTIFTTKAFQGSWEVINKFNWLGWLMNFIISSFSLLGLCLVMYQRLVTLLYLSGRNLWDTVNEVKSQNQGEWFGFESLLKNTFNTNRGTGLDALLTFFYGLLPNVKSYSDYADGKMLSNLSDDDNALNYMLKTAPQTILIIFFFALGFGGLLGQIYGTIVDGMVAFADNAVKINFASYVDKFFQAGTNYRFHLADQGTELGHIQQTVAKRAYQEVISRSGITDQQMKTEIGAYIEKQVAGGINDSKLSMILKETNGQKLTDADWTKVSPTVSVVSGNELKSNINLNIPVGQYLHSPDGKQYTAVVNIVPDRTAVNYFQ